MERIGFGPRFLAGLIDGIILIVVVYIIGMVFGVGMMGMSGGVGGFSIGLLVMMLVPLAYSSLEILKAQTPGKMVMKIIIRNADGTPASQDVLIKRWAIKNSGSLLNFLGALTTMSIFGTLGSIAGLIVFIGCFMVFTQGLQALHDRVAATAVYRAS